MSPASAVRAGLFSLTLAAPVAASALSQTASAPAQPQSVAPKDPTYTLLLVPTRVVRCSTAEGTWKSVDIRSEVAKKRPADVAATFLSDPRRTRLQHAFALRAATA